MLKYNGDERPTANECLRDKFFISSPTEWRMESRDSGPPKYNYLRDS